MKIDKIEICNLASIEGEQVIDFNQEPLCSAGLFAITGNTGAGKSTILDAICLALYNEAPRLGNREVNGKTTSDDAPSIYNTCNMLRRGATRGYSRITFSLSDNSQYMATWTVGLTRNNTYRAIERELILLRPKHIVLADKNKEVQTKISEILKLDYSQFTRTVILAQNSFSNFLSAKRGEKSQLLEKITGTELYANISRSIYNKAKEAENLYNGALQHLEGIGRGMMEDEDLQRTVEELNLRKGMQTKYANEQTRIIKQLEWYAQYDKAQQDLQEKKQQLYKVQQSYDSMYDQQRELERYDKLQPFARTYHNIIQCEHNVNQLKSDTSSKQVLADQFKKDVEQSQRKLKEALTRQLTAQQLLSMKQSDIDRGRRIEGELATLADTLRAAQEDLRLHEDDLTQRNETRNAKEAELRDCKTRLNVARVAVQTMIQHQNMISNMEFVRMRLQKMNELRYDISAAEAAMKESNRKLTHCKESEHSLVEEMCKLNEVKTRLNAELLIHEQANSGQTSREIQMRLSKLSSLAMRSGEARVLWSRIDKRFTDLSDKADELRRRKDMNEQRGNEIVKMKIRIEVLTSNYEQVHNTYTLSQSEDISSLRMSLKEGSPCPLCGSTHHPYHSDSHEQLDQLLENLKEQHRKAQSELQNAQLQLSQLQQSYSDEQGRLDVEHSLLQRMRSDQEEDIANWKNFADLDPSFTRCDGNVNRYNRRVILEQIHESSCKERDEVNELLVEFSKHQDEINRINSEIQATQLQITENSRLQAQVVAARQVEDSNIATYQQTIEACKHKQTVEASRIDPIITISGWKERWQNSYEAFDRELAAIKNKWDESKEIVDEEEKTQYRLQQELNALDKSVEDLVRERQVLLGKSELYKHQVEKHQEELRTLFGNSTVDKEATRLNADVSKAEEETKSAQEDFNNAKEKLNSVAGEINSLNKQCEEQEKERQSLRTSLDIDISRFNSGQGSTVQYFELEKYFTNSRDWARLREKIDLLKSQREAISFKVEASSQVVDALDQSEYRPSDSDPEESKAALMAKKESLVVEIKNNDEERHRLEFRIQSHNEGKRNMDEFRPTLMRSKQNSDYWQELCGVLGSADGKAFREIAQCYTFEFLVDYANQQLADLTPRYKLQTHPGTLQLDVVDRNMLDQVRAVNSLSGGESFIISLSLALGLSSLSSNNLEIGSLFIDEGFGNLDNENLNMVIDALSNLQNTQRRRVGVISHTELIRSRISPKICLLPEPGGRSTIVVKG